MMFDFSLLLAPAGGRPAARPARQAPGGPPRAAPPAWRRRAAALPATLLGALCLLATAPAGAQTQTTVWSATLTTQEYHTGHGCYRPDCETSLTSNQFTNDGNAEPEVALFPAASALQGFVRVINESDHEGTVRVRAIDDAGEEYDPLTLAIGAGEVVHFNSNDLESGNAAKGLTGGTGPGEGNWRLAFETDLDVQVLGYVRTPDGFLTSMHDTVVGSGGVYEVAFFNPGSNTSQVSVLRLVNRSASEAAVTIRGLDDTGEAGAGEVRLTIPAGAARMLRAAALESGGDEFDGALGDGRGKWRLTVDSDQLLAVMSLLRSPDGYLTNLSTAPRRRAEATRIPRRQRGRRPSARACGSRPDRRSTRASKAPSAKAPTPPRNPASCCAHGCASDCGPRPCPFNPCRRQRCSRRLRPERGRPPCARAISRNAFPAIWMSVSRVTSGRTHPCLLRRPPPCNTTPARESRSPPAR